MDSSRMRSVMTRGSGLYASRRPIAEVSKISFGSGAISPIQGMVQELNCCCREMLVLPTAMPHTGTMRTTGTYVIERTEVLRKAYRLLCIFFANKEIARRSPPDDDDAPLKALERLFLEADASRLLVEVAVAVRVLDDQIRRRPACDPQRVEHERRMAAVRNYHYGMFDDLNLDLRETCNKIIHSDVMEPQVTSQLVV